MNFKVVDEKEGAVPTFLQPASEPTKAPQDTTAATNMLLLALRALSQRSIVALGNLFTLLTVGSVWWLCLSIPSPTVLQLILIGMYALFVLAANWIIRR